MRHALYAMAFAAAATSVAQAEFSLDYEARLNGTKTREVFEPQRQVLQESSALIYRGYKRVIFGVIMSEDGYILTKASELEPAKPAAPPVVQGAPAAPPAEAKEEKEEKPLAVRVGEDVLYEDVKVVAIDATWDLALLKIDAKGLKPMEFAENSQIAQGSWVICNGASSRDKRRVKIGIVSAKPREIPGPAPVVMGVNLQEKKGKLMIRSVAKDGAAAEAGLKGGDQIIAADGKEVNKRDALVDMLIGKQPGDALKLKISREKKELELEIKLKARPTAARPQRMNKNDSMSGRFSRRRDSFPRVLQVDIPMQERSCGGPLINLDGKCVGLIIARANRAETFAVPVEELKEAYQRLLEENKAN